MLCTIVSYPVRSGASGDVPCVLEDGHAGLVQRQARFLRKEQIGSLDNKLKARLLVLVKHALDIVHVHRLIKNTMKKGKKEEKKKRRNACQYKNVIHPLHHVRWGDHRKAQT